MTVNHQYTAGTNEYSGASELTYTPTWIPGIAPNGSHAPVKVVRRGSLVTISGLLVVTPNVIPQGTILTTLPVEFRPSGGIIALDGKTIVGTQVTNVIFNLQGNGQFGNDNISLANYFYLNQTFWV